MTKLDTLTQATQYFKTNKGFTRMLEKMKNKYTSFDRETPGNIIIEKPTKEEKEAISGFMKKDYARNKTITISLKKFQERLDQTRFEGITIKELLENYYGKEIITQKKQKQQKTDQFNEYLAHTINEHKETIAGKILEKIKQEKNENYIMLKTKYDKETIELKNSIKQACNCINNLPPETEKLRLPIFATKILNNPHGLDRKNLTGKLFITLLNEKEENNKKIKNSEDLSELYYKNNLLIDDVSNMVLCKNIIGYQGNKEHNGWKGFFENNEAIQITLDNLSQIDNIQVKHNQAIVVENPAVFMQIAQKIENKKIPLVCTYGQIKLSGIVLLKMLNKVCDKIYYSGDTDPEGIQIADKIKTKFKEKIQLIGFDTDTYYKTISNVTISNERLKKLEHIENTELQDIVKALQKEKRAAYEENKINKIFPFSWKLR